ncbi:hypothetical protein ACWCOV_12120 [Kribbella sp. NPDC002412]
MLRPTAAKAVATAATTLILLTACGGSDDKTDAKSGDGGETPASTPSTPKVPSFDPPKAFVPVSAFGVERTPKDNDFTLSAGMVGQTSLLAGLTGVTGRNIAAQGEQWTVPSAEASTTETLDLTTPMGVQVDGKDVVAIGYVQKDKGNGTQKAKGQVLVQWLDATDGKKVAEVAVDLTPLLGPGEGGDDVVSQAYDAATGQVAIGVSPGSEAAAKKAGTFTVYADPKTQKSSVIPFVSAAGVLNGVVAGAKGRNQEGAADGTIVLADGATGKITKQFPTKQNYLWPVGNGTKRAYLAGNSYVSSKKGTLEDVYDNVLYSVDIATGAVVPQKAAYTEDSMSFKCFGDKANAAVCTGSDNNKKLEILGLDDTTGKKTWGYTSDSASRVIPEVTAAFHGIVYAQTEAQPVLMDAVTGEDVKTNAPTPTDGTTPTDGSSPSEGSTPTGNPSSQGADPGSANGSDMSLYTGKPQSPDAVSQYGGAYLTSTGQSSYIAVLIALAPTA